MATRALGRYRLLGELGRGAMGTVHRAVDPLIEREVALKTLLPDLEDESGEIRTRFLREARSAGRLSHPGIVTIFDVGEEGGIAYIAMELLEGRSLLQMMRSGERLPVHAVADIVAQVAEALHHAHGYAIVHRDVKPANIVVSAAGRAKLTDFGVAYVPASNVTQHGAALGSPRYMAPEQVLGQPIDARADIFSLGVVLYELLTGRNPFQWPGDTTVYALLQRIAGEPHPPLRQADSRIPLGFERIVDRALAKRPQDRYASAAELAQDLRHYQSLGGGTEFEDTVPQATLRPAAVIAEERKVREQLLEDLESFAKHYQPEQAPPPVAREEPKRAPREDPAALGTTRRMEAVEILRQQAVFRRQQAEAKQAQLEALNAAMRAAQQYLSEFAKELNAHQPHAGASYEFIYVGKVGSGTLGQAEIKNRTFQLPGGEERCAQVLLHYWLKPEAPPKFLLLGEDVARCEQYLKSLRVAFEKRTRGDERERPVQFVVTGALPCDVNLRADFEQGTATVELVNVRRFGRVTVRLDAATFQGAIDDIARYALGVDDDFEKLLPQKS